MLPEIVPFQDLQELSDYRKPMYVRKWLDNLKVPYAVSRNGLPRVHRLALANALGVKAVEPASNEPDFDKWEG